VKSDRAWVRLQSGAQRSMRELTGTNRPAMCKDKQPRLLRSSPTESSQANAPSNYEKSQAAKTCAANASGAARVRAVERPRAAHALAPPSRMRPRDAVFGKEDQMETAQCESSHAHLGSQWAAACSRCSSTSCWRCPRALGSGQHRRADDDAKGTGTTVGLPQMGSSISQREAMQGNRRQSQEKED
jgi:hypothetical protein